MCKRPCECGGTSVWEDGIAHTNGSICVGSATLYMNKGLCFPSCQLDPTR